MMSGAPGVVAPYLAVRAPFMYDSTRGQGWRSLGVHSCDIYSAFFVWAQYVLRSLLVSFSAFQEEAVSSLCLDGRSSVVNKIVGRKTVDRFFSTHSVGGL